MSAQVASRFLDLRALAALEHMRFATRQRIEGSYSGRHSSRRQGGAGEFVDFREYTDGEDLRRLDWKVLARTGRAYVRLFQDETNLVCTLAVDISGSMRFGGRSARGLNKLQYCQFLGTALAHVIVRGQDQVGLALLAGDLTSYLPPRSTSTHLNQIYEGLERIELAPTITCGPGLRHLFERSSGRGVLIIMSDFLMDDLDEVFAAIRLFRHRQFEVIVLHIIDPGEERLPEGTAFRFEGLENEGRMDCSPAEIRDLYQERFRAHTAAVRTLSLAAGCDYRRISTATPYLQTLGQFLVERAG